MLDATASSKPKLGHFLPKPVAWMMRTYLSLLVLIVLIPQIALGGLIAYKYAQDARKSVEESTVRIAATYSDALDRYLEGAAAAIQTLATSSEINDLKALDARARQLVPFRGTAVSMRDKTGQQLLNTIVPFGTELPRTASDVVREADARVYATGVPVFSDLYQGTVSSRWFFLVDVPVEQDGERRFALNIAISADDLKQAMFKGLPTGWSAAILDGKQRVMARAAEHDRFVGRLATENLIRKLRANPTGSLESRTLDGSEVFTSYVTSSLSGYSVVISTPRSLLEKPINELWLSLASIASLTFLSSILAAWWWARRMVTSLVSIERAASISGDGPAQVVRTPIVEFNSLSASIVNAANAIQGKSRHQSTLIAELNHRVKNTLAILQAITVGTAKAKSTRDVGEALRFRIHGLSAAHDLLTENNWTNVEIDSVMKAVSRTTGHVVDGIRGPRIALEPKAVVSLSQIFTELCEGAVLCEILTSRVEWTAVSGTLSLKWEGVCNPEVLERADPFSMKIIHLCVERQLGGTFEFRRSGDEWLWICEIPLQSHLGDIGRLADAP